MRMTRFPITAAAAAALTMLVSISTVVSADEDRASLRFGVSAAGAPMAFFDHGVLRGLEVDLARALADDMNVQLRLQEMPQPRLIDALRGGRIDLVLSTLPEPDLRALGLVASGTLLGTGQMALIRAEDVATFGRLLDIMTTQTRVGYQRGSAGARFVQANLPNAERVPVTDATWGIAALRAGDIDLFIHDATTVWAIAADPDETELLGIFRPLTEERLAWIMRAEDELLARNVNNTIRSWQESGRLARLINRWIRTQVEIKH
jgi:ABC-type amino acid transport substrate-binding protein